MQFTRLCWICWSWSQGLGDEWRDRHPENVDSRASGFDRELAAATVTRQLVCRCGVGVAGVGFASIGAGSR